MHNQPKEFSKIMVAIDGSQPSMNAANSSINLAKKNNARLIGLFVVPPNLTFGYLDEYTLPELPANIRLSVSNIVKTGKRYLENIRREAIKNDILFDSKVLVRSSSVVSSIVQYAEDNEIDLIVMGTIGISGFKRLMLGSTASGVVTYAHCPVLLVR
jgi:nucleotide-binding universal stress UspA family protein